MTSSDSCLCCRYVVALSADKRMYGAGRARVFRAPGWHPRGLSCKKMQSLVHPSLRKLVNAEKKKYSWVGKREKVIRRANRGAATITFLLGEAQEIDSAWPGKQNPSSSMKREGTWEMKLTGGGRGGSSLSWESSLCQSPPTLTPFSPL